MKRAGTHAAVTYVSNCDNGFLLHACGEQHASHHGNHVAEMRNRTNEAFRHVAEMNIQIASARWSPGFRHILRKDLARANSLYQHRPKIANQGGNKILWPQRVGAADGSCLLAQRTADAADNLGLAI